MRQLGNSWGNSYFQFLAIISCFTFSLLHGYGFSRKLSDRSSRPEVFSKKSVLRKFAKFTEKHQSLFFNKVAGLRSATLLKNRLWQACFPVNFAKFLRTPFFTEHSQWLLLEWMNISFKRRDLDSPQKCHPPPKGFGNLLFHLLLI